MKNLPECYERYRAGAANFCILTSMGPPAHQRWVSLTHRVPTAGTRRSPLSPTLGLLHFLSDTVEKIRRIQVERALGSVQSRRASVPARRWVQTAPPMERLKDCHIVLARTPALRPARQGKPQERPPTKLASTILVLETNGRDTTAHSSSPVCRAGAGRITGRNVASLEARLRGTRESASR